MKQMVCEMCGSTDLIKQEGVFVCQTCGTKYSVEEAKKMIIEGTVDVSGSSVKIDQSDELGNLYTLARRARNDNDHKKAMEYYNQILIKDPNNWEANFYAAYCGAAFRNLFTVIQYESCEFIKSITTTLHLVKDYVEDSAERKAAVTEMASRVIALSSAYTTISNNYYNMRMNDKSTKEYFEQNELQQYVDNCYATKDILYRFGDDLVKIFGDEYSKDIAVPCWKEGVRQHSNLMPRLANKEVNKNTIMSYVAKVQRYDPSYQVAVNSSNGCYVATAVYGSYDCPQVWTLRRYRDYTLAETWYGRVFIRAYYAISPTIVKRFGHTEWFKKMWRGKLDSMVANLKAKGVEDTPYTDITWK